MEPQNEEKVTIESLYALLDKSEKRNEREWEKMRETDQKRMEELNQHLKESEEKFDREMDKMRKEIGGIGSSNGEFAEEYFIDAFKENPSLNGEIYDRVVPNARFIPVEDEIIDEFTDEYDIFLSNAESAAIIEIKYNVGRGDIKSLLEKGENFRKFFPNYNRKKLYLGIAALSFRKTTEKKISEKGIAVIKQVGGKMIINSENLKAF